MQADRDDRFNNNDRNGDGRGRHSTQTLVTAVAVLILAGAAYLLMPGDDDEDSIDTSLPAPQTDVNMPEIAPKAPAPTPDALILAAPDIPVVETSDPEPAIESLEEPEAETVQVLPPTPEELDQQLRAAIDASGLTPGNTLGSAYNAGYLLDRSISSIDQLARGLVPGRTSNIARPPGVFKTTQDGADYWVSRDSYRRYDKLVAAIIALPAETLATLFHGQRSLLEDAYAALGYPKDALDNTVIAALDNVLSAPIREQPPALVSKGALWAYADTGLEGASDVHKQLLRTGPENTEALQAWARQLKKALLNP